MRLRSCACANYHFPPRGACLRRLRSRLSLSLPSWRPSIEPGSQLGGMDVGAEEAAAQRHGGIGAANRPEIGVYRNAPGLLAADTNAACSRREPVLRPPRRPARAGDGRHAGLGRREG
jgi:hypothetical protein